MWDFIFTSLIIYLYKMTEEKNIKNIIESILLVAEKPVNIKELATVCNAHIAIIQKATQDLTKDYKDRGIKLIRKGDLYHIVSDPENAEYVAKYLNDDLRGDLSRAALETLAIITYKQPITRMEVEDVRGVNSDYVVRNLMIRGLIEEVGRKEALGRPILYGTTMEFLQFFGLENEDQLPSVDNITAPEKKEEEKLIEAN